MDTVEGLIQDIETQECQELCDNKFICSGAITLVLDSFITFITIVL